MASQHNYFIIFDTAEGAFISYNEKTQKIIVFPSEKQAREAFELNYQRNLRQESITWHTSALLHWMSLRPFVVAMPATLTPLDVLTTLAVSDAADLEAYSLFSDAVRQLGGIKVDLATCRQYQVSKINLINPDWWQPEIDAEELKFFGY